MALQERTAAGANVTPHGVGAQPAAMLALRDAYLSWVETTEMQLQNISLNPAMLSALHTPRYWRIRSLGEDPRPFPLVDAEVRQQVAGSSRCSTISPREPPVAT